MNFVTILTDFGLGNPYVSQMKGVIYSIAPQARCIDITHLIPSQQIQIGSFILESVVHSFPRGTIHIGVVDPGVGTYRRGIVVVTNEHVFIGPDNGLLIAAAKKQGSIDVYEITNDSLYNSKISHTFHGRDIFAPIAAHILRGISFNQIGRKITDYKTLPSPKKTITQNHAEVEVLFIDDFGNIITNLDEITFHSLIKFSKTCKISIHNQTKEVPYAISYGHLPRNKLLVTIGSAGYVEIAVNQGNASKELNVCVGDTVIFDFTSLNHTSML